MMTEMKTNRGKTLIAVVAVAMIACAFAFVIPADESDATQTISVTNTAEFVDALNDAAAGSIIELASGNYGNEPVTGSATVDTSNVIYYDQTNGYTSFLIDKPLTIKAAANANPMIYGSFFVNSDDVSFEDVSITMTYMNNNERNAFNVVGSDFSLTNCIINVAEGSTNLVNGVMLYPKTGADYTISGNTFNNFNVDSEWNNVAILVFENYTISNMNVFADRFPAGETLNYSASGNFNLTAGEQLRMVSNNTFNSCEWNYSVSDYNTGSAVREIRVVGTEDSYSSGYVFEVASGAYTLIGAYNENALSLDFVDGETFTVAQGVEFNGSVSFTTGTGPSAATNAVSVSNAVAGNGGLVFTAGSVTISGNLTAAQVQTEITIIQTSGNDVVLKNLTITAGTVNIKGTVSVAGNVIVSKDATVDINDDSKLIVAKNATLSVSGTVSVNDTNSALENNGVVAITDTSATIPENVTGTGYVDTSAVASEGSLSGVYDTTTTFTKNQTITAAGNINLVSGTVFTFEGNFIIPEDVTVTIEDGAQLIVNASTGSIINNGTIIIESNVARSGFVVSNTASVENNGVIELAFMPEGNSAVTNNSQFNIISGTVTNNGQINVGVDSKISVTGTLNNASDATINMNGKFVGTIQNAGTVVFNGTTTDASTNTIYFVAAGASVQIDYLDGNLAIQDVGFVDSHFTVSSDSTDTSTTREANLLRLNGTTYTNYYFTGLTVTAEVSSVTVGKVTTYYNNLVLSGDLSSGIIDSTGTAALDNANVYTLTTDGPRIAVNDELSIDDTVGYSLHDTLNVNGTVSFESGADVTAGSGTPTINVIDGTVIATSTPISGITVNSAQYSVRTTSPAVTTYYYTTLANALASGATSITLVGNIEIDEALTIGSGVTVTKTDGTAGLNSTNTITITDDGYLTIADGGRLNSSCGAIVDGSLYVENKRTGLRGTTIANILSEVKSEGETDILFTNLVNALSNAEAGDVISLSGHADIDSNVTIPAEVTLQTAGYNVTVGNDIIFTIDGVLYINNTAGGIIIDDPATAGLNEMGEIALNGVIKGDIPLTGSSYPAGAYYTITSNGKMIYYIQPLEDAAANIATFDESTINVIGDVSVGEISIIGTADEQATLIVNNSLAATGIELGYAQIQIVNGAILDAVVSNDVGSVDVAAKGVSDATITSTVDDESTLLNIEGIFGTTTVADDEPKYTFGVEGNVDLGATTIPGMTVDGTVDVNARANVTGLLTINGTVNVPAGGYLYVTGTVALMGSLNIAPISTDGRGMATVGTIYIGAALNNAGNEIVVGADGTVSGSLNYTTAFVSAASTIPDKFGEGKNSTAFFVEDSLWITAFGTGSVNVYDAPVTDAEFLGWDDPETDAIEAINDPITLASYDKLVANIDYNIYTVGVVTDGGIGSVAIDGVLMTQAGDNAFIASDLKAGQHTVTYTLKPGYEGTATMTIDGQAVSGNTFTLTGDYEGDYGIIINLAGTSPSQSGEIVVNPPEVVVNNGSNDMSLTDYLLIVLVVLIVIMAIIIALRMMRS